MLGLGALGLQRQGPLRRRLVGSVDLALEGLHFRQRRLQRATALLHPALHLIRGSAQLGKVGRERLQDLHRRRPPVQTVGQTRLDERLEVVQQRIPRFEFRLGLGGRHGPRPHVRRLDLGAVLHRRRVYLVRRRQHPLLSPVRHHERATGLDHGTPNLMGTHVSDDRRQDEQAFQREERPVDRLDDLRVAPRQPELVL